MRVELNLNYNINRTAKNNVTKSYVKPMKADTFELQNKKQPSFLGVSNLYKVKNTAKIHIEKAQQVKDLIISARNEVSSIKQISLYTTQKAKSIVSTAESVYAQNIHFLTSNFKKGYDSLFERRATEEEGDVTRRYYIDGYGNRIIEELEDDIVVKRIKEKGENIQIFLRGERNSDEVSYLFNSSGKLIKYYAGKDLLFNPEKNASIAYDFSEDGTLLFAKQKLNLDSNQDTTEYQNYSTSGKLLKYRIRRIEEDVIRKTIHDGSHEFSESGRLVKYSTKNKVFIGEELSRMESKEFSLNENEGLANFQAREGIYGDGSYNYSLELEFDEDEELAKSRVIVKDDSRPKSNSDYSFNYINNKAIDCIAKTHEGVKRISL